MSSLYAKYPDGTEEHLCTERQILSAVEQHMGSDMRRFIELLYEEAGNFEQDFIDMTEKYDDLMEAYDGLVESDNDLYEEHEELKEKYAALMQESQPEAPKDNDSEYIPF